MDLKELDNQRKLKGFSWNKLAEGLPINGDSLRIAFKRGSVDSVYLNHIVDLLDYKYSDSSFEENKDKTDISSQTQKIPSLVKNGVEVTEEEIDLHLLKNREQYKEKIKRMFGDVIEEGVRERLRELGFKIQIVKDGE